METSSSILGPLILENDWKPYPGHPKPGLTLTNKKGKTVQLDVTTCTDFGIKTKQHGRIWSTNCYRQIPFNLGIQFLLNLSSPNRGFHS